MNGSDYLTTKEAAKKYWRNFLPIWLFPLYFFMGALFLSELLGNILFMFSVGIWVLLGTGYSCKATYDADVKERQIGFLTYVAPIIIWILLLIIFFVFAMLSLAIFPQLR